MNWIGHDLCLKETKHRRVWGYSTMKALPFQFNYECNPVSFNTRRILFAIDDNIHKLTVKSSECCRRKEQAQLNVQVMCIWNLDLVYVDSNYSGKTHDKDMLLNSPLYHAI